MLRYRVAVCDDERFAAEAVAAAAARELERNHAQAEFELFANAPELARRVTEVDFDLILLDIELPGIDGIELGGILRGAGVETEIIYVSNNEARVFESMSIKPLGFVRKSTFGRDMANAMDVFVKAHRKKGTSRTVSIQTRNSLISFPVDDTLYIEARGHAKVIHMRNGLTEQVVATFEEFTEKLEPLGFYRVHKGFLVNFAHVSRIDAEGVHIGEALIPISRTKTAEVRTAFMDYLQSKDSILL